MNLSRWATALRVVNATAAGATNINGTHVDMSQFDFDGILFVMGVGALTAGQQTGLKAQNGALANDSDQADIPSASTPLLADTDGNKIVLLDVFRPQLRYVRPVVLRATANAVIDFVIAIGYGGAKLGYGLALSPALDTTLKSVTTVVGS
jgi:hypothetical protein